MGLNFDSAGAAFLLGKIIEDSGEQNSLRKVIDLYHYALSVFEKLLGNKTHPELLAVKHRLHAAKERLGNHKNKNLCRIGSKNILLSKRETDCFELIKKGLSAKEMAEKLYLSPRTIESHLENIKLKCHCKTKLELLSMLSETK